MNAIDLHNALNAIRALHRPTRQEVLPHDCWEGLCLHDGDCVAERHTVCAHCASLVSDDETFSEEVVWPCPTIVALGDLDERTVEP